MTLSRRAPERGDLRNMCPAAFPYLDDHSKLLTSVRLRDPKSYLFSQVTNHEMKTLVLKMVAGSESCQEGLLSRSMSAKACQRDSLQSLFPREG